MDDYLRNLKELLGLICRQTWGTPGFWVIGSVALLALFFGSGTMARVIFGKDTGLVKTFVAMLVVFIAGAATATAWLTWGNDSCAIAGALGAAVALGALYPAAKFLRIPYGPAFGIGVFSLGLFAGVAQGGGRACKALADSSASIEEKSSARFKSAR